MICALRRSSLVHQSQRPSLAPELGGLQGACSQQPGTPTVVVLPPFQQGRWQKDAFHGTLGHWMRSLWVDDQVGGPSLSEWQHWTSARLISPLLSWGWIQNLPWKRTQHCPYQPHSEQLTFIAYLLHTSISCTQRFNDTISLDLFNKLGAGTHYCFKMSHCTTPPAAGK